MSRAVERAAGALKPNQHPPRCAPSTAQVYQKRHWAERELAKASSRPEDLSACLQSRARSLGTMVTLRAQINRRPLATLLVAIPLTVAIISYMINVIERVSRASGHFGKQFNAFHATAWFEVHILTPLVPVVVPSQSPSTRQQRASGNTTTLCWAHSAPLPQQTALGSCNCCTTGL